MVHRVYHYGTYATLGITCGILALILWLKRVKISMEIMKWYASPYCIYVVVFNHERIGERHIGHVVNWFKHSSQHPA